MKKFLSIILAVCVISTLLVMPASAGTFDYALDLSAATVVSYDANLNGYTVAGTAAPASDFPISNLFDGNTNSTAVISYVGQATRFPSGNNLTNTSGFLTSNVVIDMGASYSVSSVELAYTTDAQAIDVASAYPGYENAPSANWKANRIGSVTLYDKLPSDASATSYPVASGSSTNMPMQATNVPINSASQFRYISISSGGWPNSGMLLLNELMIKVAAPDDNSVKYAAFFGDNAGTSDPDYAIQNLFDGDKTTSALIGGASGGRAVRFIDLGESKNLTKIKITAPTDYAGALSDLGITNSNNGNRCNIYVTNTLPVASTYAEAEAAVSSMTHVFGGVVTTQDIDLDGTNPYRYIAIYQSMASASAIISELDFGWDDRAGSVSFETSAATGEVSAAKVNYYSQTGFSASAALPISNIFDNDSSTYGLVGSLNASNTFGQGTIVIDLGKEVYLQSASWRTPTAEEATALVEAAGITTARALVNGGIYASKTAPTINADGTVTGMGTDLKAGHWSSTWGPGSDRWSSTTLDGTVAYRYVTIQTGGAWTLLISDFKLLDTDGNNVFENTKDAIRFYVAPTLTSKFYDTEEFGMYIVPFNLFNDDATENGVVMSMNGKIVTGQNYAADLTDIPADAADEPIVVVPFVKLGGDYFYGDASSQYTLNGLK